MVDIDRRGPEDPEEGYRKAAEHGHAGAQFNLGVMCEQLPELPRSAYITRDGRQTWMAQSGAAMPRDRGVCMCGSRVQQLSGRVHLGLHFACFSAWREQVRGRHRRGEG